MNKATKIILAISLTMIIAGGAVFGVGVAMGGTLNINYFFSDGHFKIASAGNDLVSDSVSLKEFDKIVLHTSVTDINITKGDSYSISYKVREEFVPTIENNNGTLSVNCTNKGINFSLFNFGSNENEYITITVPADKDCTDIQIEGSTADITIRDLCICGSVDVSTGDIKLSNVSGEKLYLETSTGDKEINSCRFEELKLHSSTGENKINDSTFTTLISDSSTGDVKIADSEADFITIDTSTGDVKLSLYGKMKDYDYNLHSSTGDIRVDDNEYNKDYNRDEDCDRNIKIHASTGDIKINFK